ncbi:hypothetical protein SLEP1_g54066 [Rubroshorea leprosula]|uniref:Uncharacterized protein n=1 Tax=Rubroshorea leprosula TaxID=152421 RepID=A0AAV5MBF6_9ROSI|nr:hypothetical protein SLEP1_g54066 [Rubroshorea leprosula]
MDSLRELRELRGNQGREEEEEEGVISAEPIAMIVPLELQDLLETMAPESSASSSAKDNGGDHPTASSSSSSSEETPSREEGIGGCGWSCLRPACSWGVGKQNDHGQAKQSAKGAQGSARWRTRVGANAANAQQYKVHHWLYAVVCAIRGTGQGDRVQVAVSMPAGSHLSRRKVVLPFRAREEPAVQERPEQSGELLTRDTNLKNRLLEHARSENLIDLEALVTPKLLAVFGFADVANLFNEGSRGRGAGSTSQRQTRFDERPPPAPQSRSSSHRGSSLAPRPRADHRAKAAAPNARRRPREETKSEDEVPLIRRKTSGGTQPAEAAGPAVVGSPTARVAAEPASTSASVSGPKIAYPEGFSYVKAECQPAMVQGMHNFVPPSDSKRAKAFEQQYGAQVAMIKLMDAFNYAVALYESEQRARTQNRELGSKCKQLAAEKASLMDDVNCLQGFEMVNRAAAAESRADELANRNNELREELEQARAERESGIQAAKEEAARVAEADQNLTAAREALNELKTSHARSVSIARAQAAEWFVGSAAFQDAVAVASANVTTEIYNEIRGKGKSLAPLVDATVRLRWDLNEEGVPVWPLQVLEDGEDPARLPSSDAWVEGAPVAEQEPSSTPPNSQPVVVLASLLVSAPAFEPAARSPLARSPAAAADASIPVDLTDD